MCEPDKAIRIALGGRHAEKCAMRKTLSGGFWIVFEVCPIVASCQCVAVFEMVWFEHVMKVVNLRHTDR